MTPPAVTISTSTVEPITWEPGIETIGTALAGQGVDLSTEAAGVVREIPFAANDRVEKGALLLQIDDRTERADLESAQASLALAKTELERAQALQARGSPRPIPCKPRRQMKPLQKHKLRNCKPSLKPNG